MNRKTAKSKIKKSGKQTNKPDFCFVLSRVDFYNPDTKYNNNNNYASGYNNTKETFATLGLDFIPYKNVYIMLNLWYDQFHGKSPGASGDLKNDYDLEGRITLYFLFNK